MSSVETTTSVPQTFPSRTIQTFQTTASAAQTSSAETNNISRINDGIPRTTNIENDTNSGIFADVMIRYHSIDTLTIVICIWVVGKN